MKVSVSRLVVPMVVFQSLYMSALAQNFDFVDVKMQIGISAQDLLNNNRLVSDLNPQNAKASEPITYSGGASMLSITYAQPNHEIKLPQTDYAIFRQSGGKITALDVYAGDGASNLSYADGKAKGCIEAFTKAGWKLTTKYSNDIAKVTAEMPQDKEFDRSYAKFTDGATSAHIFIRQFKPKPTVDHPLYRCIISIAGANVK